MSVYGNLNLLKQTSLFIQDLVAITNAKPCANAHQKMAFTEAAMATAATISPVALFSRLDFVLALRIEVCQTNRDSITQSKILI